jgi:hypothetical protein
VRYYHAVLGSGRLAQALDCSNERYDVVRSKELLLLALLLASCSPIRGCVESQFTLGQDSRLPKWFRVPPGYTRADVIVELTYYVPIFPVNNAVMELVNRNGKTLAQVTGEVCWHPVMGTKKNQHGGFNPDSYPHYVYIRANGVVEIIEHARGPTFRVKDDPMLLKGALEAKQCDKG